ncbi:MAG: AAA family ATPase [Rhizobiales bacterium]|nr:AAA family ATPase [Hyphomicrobiales bacterium]
MLALARSHEIKNALCGLLMERNDISLETEVGSLKSVGPGFSERLNRASMLLVDLDIEDPNELTPLRQITRRASRQPLGDRDLQGDHGAGRARLVRQGIDDFVPQPLDQQSLLEAIDVAKRKIRQNRSGGPSAGQVITVGRAKGGMGATTLAVNLALSLIQPIGKEEPRRVCLLDLDLQFGDAALYLDLEPRSDLVEIVQKPTRLDTSLLLSAMTEHKSGLEVLQAPVEPMPLDALRTETVGRIIDLAQQEFDYVVVDLPLALASWYEMVLDMTDKLYLVTQLNVPAIRQTRRLIDILKDEGLYNLPVSIVLNRYVRRFNEHARIKQCSKALDNTIDHYLAEDESTVLEAINRGVALAEVRRRSKICRTIRNMALDCRRELAARNVRPAYLS